jgi:WD40 repeat protein
MKTNAPVHWVQPRLVCEFLLGSGLTKDTSGTPSSRASGSLESADGERYGAVRICDTRRGAVLLELTAHRDATTFVTFSPAGSVLASAGLDNTVKLWNVRTGQLTKTFKITVPKWSGILQFAFSPDGKTLASGSQDGKVCLRDVSRLRT